MSTPSELDIHDLRQPLPTGATLIEASAGTGKTYTIAAIFLRLLVERGLAVDAILVTTFTIPATAELRDRIRRLLREAAEAFSGAKAEHPLVRELVAAHVDEMEAIATRLRDALRGFDEAAIDTMHAFCQRVLTRFAFESGVAAEAELLTDESELHYEVACDYWRRHFYACPLCLAAAAGEAGLSVASLSELLRDRLQQPTASCLPPYAEGELPAAQAALTAAWSAVRACWLAAREEIEVFFTTRNEWANSPYNKGEEMRARLDRVALGLATETPPFLPFDALVGFAASELADGTRARARTPTHRFFDLCEALKLAIHRYSLAVQLDFLAWAPAELGARKQKANLLSFGDLLARLHGELRSERGAALQARLRQQYRAALIDEFQDTDPLQAEIFERLFGGDADGWLFLIGDPKQAIFGFRGADVFTYLAASARAGRHWTLGRNFRSTTPLVQAVNSVFQRDERAFIVRAIAFHPARSSGRADAEPLTGDGTSAPLRLWSWEGDAKLRLEQINRQLADATAAEIARLLSGPARLGGRRLRPSDFAVLTVTNDQALLMQDALHRFGVPLALLSTSSVFKSREARELLILMHAVCRPRDEPRLRAALLTETFGLGMHGVLALGSDSAAWEEWSLRLIRWQALWLEGGFITMFRRLLRDAAVRPRLLAHADGERRLTNLSHLAELVQQASAEAQLSPLAAAKWLGQRVTLAPAQEDRHELRLERDDDAVRIVTVHKSKGLEYNLVFCPFSWRVRAEKTKPRLRFHDDSGQAQWDLGLADAPQNRARSQMERLAEDVRLMYVALTRARHRCDIALARLPSHLPSALNWLLQGGPPDRALAEADRGDALKVLKEYLKKVPDAAWRERLRTLTEQANGTVALMPVPSVETPPYQPERLAPARRTARVFRAEIERDFAVSSFSSLTQTVAADSPERFAPPWMEDAEKPSGLDDIHAFPAGARSGVCLHEIFERLDFTDLGGLEPLVVQQLKAAGFDAGRWSPAVMACVRRVLATPLPGGGRLGDIEASARLAEREFHLPVSRLHAATLMPLLGGGEPALAFSPRHGWLKGFIDLVFRHGERFYVLDWKSNRLGASAAAYTAANVDAAMAAHHYRLQARLYAVALQRYLRQRLPAYDHARHFGGMIYLFVRGLDPDQPGQGVWFERPEAEALAALDRWLGGN